MTDGHDGDDDREVDDDAGESRDRNDQSGTDWNRPWPSEMEDDEETQPRSDTEGPSTPPRASSSHQQDHREGANQAQGQRETSSSSATTITAESGGRTVPNDSVAITDSARGDQSWIDLSEHVPRGEALAASDLPEEKLEEYTTDRRSLNPLVQIHWGIRVTIGAFILGMIATWGLGTLRFDQQFGGAVLAALVLLGLLWVVLYYRLWCYEIRADAIYLERGVVTNVRSLVPYVRIQHVDTSRSPIERMLGLSTLVVYTAGSRGADVSIPGLQPEDARDLQRRVKELAIEAEGDDAL